MRNKKDILFWCELNTFSGEKMGRWTWQSWTENGLGTYMDNQKTLGDRRDIMSSESQPKGRCPNSYTQVRWEDWQGQTMTMANGARCNLLKAWWSYFCKHHHHHQSIKVNKVKQNLHRDCRRECICLRC